MIGKTPYKMEFKDEAEYNTFIHSDKINLLNNKEITKELRRVNEEITKRQRRDNEEIRTR